MPRDAIDIIRGLNQKGFFQAEGDHHFFRLYIEGKKQIIRTKVSHGVREIGDNLLGTMARQIGLSRRDFLQLIDCPLSLDRYVEILRESGKLDLD